MYSGEDHDFSLGLVGSVALRVTLLFGLMGIALVLIFVPGVERRSETPVAGEFDMMTTGSIRPDDSYSAHRGVFRQAP